MQAGLDVLGEGGRRGQADVAETVEVVGEGGAEVVKWLRDSARRGDVGDWWGVGFPLGAGGVEDCGRWDVSMVVVGGRSRSSYWLRRRGG